MCVLCVVIWGELDEDFDGLLCGVVFVVDVMGFIFGEEEVCVMRFGCWMRFVFCCGYVFVCGFVVFGFMSVWEIGLFV